MYSSRLKKKVINLFLIRCLDESGDLDKIYFNRKVLGIGQETSRNLSYQHKLVISL